MCECHTRFLLFKECQILCCKTITINYVFLSCIHIYLNKTKRKQKQTGKLVDCIHITIKYSNHPDIKYKKYISRQRNTIFVKCRLRGHSRRKRFQNWRNRMTEITISFLWWKPCRKYVKMMFVPLTVRLGSTESLSQITC